MREDVTFDEYRTGYIAEKHNVTDNAARALQLFELGYTTSGASNRLPVTESTVQKYHKNLMNNIHENVVFSLSPDSTRFDVWGDRDISDYGELGYSDGVADAQASTTQSTDRKEQIDPEFRSREKPLNRGVPLEEIANELITIQTGE